MAAVLMALCEQLMAADQHLKAAEIYEKMLEAMSESSTDTEELTIRARALAGMGKVSYSGWDNPLTHAQHELPCVLATQKQQQILLSGCIKQSTRTVKTTLTWSRRGRLWSWLPPTPTAARKEVRRT